MVVAETLAGLALVNSAVKGIKGAIGTAKDISSIADDIDNLFKGTKEVKQKAHPIASKWDKFLGKTLGESADKFSLGAIAKETIEERLAEEQLFKVRQMVNLRFGSTTWDDILLERQERIDQHKKEVEDARRKKNKSKQRVYKILETIGSAILVIGSVVAVFCLIIFNMKK
jgi:hypothetical protein